ncbi:MAG TPA: PTS sugar transporter subunit IIC [Deltaproteobacteria bacterium]|nr:PTS sugar transporter subunit IIC [Deltaproteobacteria bacterium]HQI79984.1 PTS sugar transporter subunit IIC [Deltaproteobacteria bacterium]
MITAGMLGVLAGAALWMDRVFLFQFMVSRPVIMGPLIGLVMGDPRVGIMVGASLELLWLNSPPVGAYLPHDESFCTAVAVPVAIAACRGMDPAAASGFAILLSLPTAMAGRILDTRLRTMNEGLIPPGTEAGERDVSMALGKAVLRAFLLALTAILLCVAVISAAAVFLGALLPDIVVKALKLMPFACVVVGLAALVSREMPRKLHAGLFAVGMVLVILLAWMW